MPHKDYNEITLLVTQESPEHPPMPGISKFDAGRWVWNPTLECVYFIPKGHRRPPSHNPDVFSVLPYNQDVKVALLRVLKLETDRIKRLDMSVEAI